MLEALLPDHWSLIITGGLVVGFLVGMTGVGAGSLMTPFLITKVGIQPAIAVGTDLLFAAITKASAVAPHHTLGHVNWRIVRWLAAGSVPGSIGMLALIKFLEPDLATMGYVIRTGLSVALIVSSITLIAFPLMRRTPFNGASDEMAQLPARPFPTVLLGLLLGSVVTLTSVGAGAIGVVVLTLLYPALRPRYLIGTDIVHAVPLTLVSGLGHLSMGNTDFMLLAMLLAGSLPGIAVGSRLTGLLPDWILRTALAAILVFAAYQLITKT